MIFKRLWLMSLVMTAVAAPASAQPTGLCAAAVAGAEAAEAIPRGLLAAIARVESGRFVSGGVAQPWPWTINAEGKGRYFDSKDEAMAETGRLLGRRVGLVDVGCMGVNLYHHPTAFRSLQDAFEPGRNAAYAARFLRALYRETGSWTAAVGRYHSGDPARAAAYTARVYTHWKGRSANLPPEPTPAPAEGPLEQATQAFAAGRLDRAAALFADVLEATPDDRNALLGVGMVLEVQGLAADARAVYRRLLALDGRNAVAMTNLLDLIGRLPLDEQRRELGSLRSLLPQSAEVAARLAESLSDLGETAEAAALVGEAVRLDPQRPVHRLSHAILLDRLGRHGEAMREYEAFFAAAPDADLPGVSVETVRRRLAYLKTTTR